MFGKPYYFSLIRKYVILMGTLLNDIRITRTDANGNVTALLKIPITEIWESGCYPIKSDFFKSLF